MPLRRDITKRCTCPDDDNWDSFACKHVVAAMFTLSNEFLLEPELLDLWRDHDADDDQVLDDKETPRRHLRLVGSPDNAVGDDESERAARQPREDPLRQILKFPDGSELPDIPRFEPFEPVQPKTRELSSILRDALGNLRMEWD